MDPKRLHPAPSVSRYLMVRPRPTQSFPNLLHLAWRPLMHGENAPEQELRNRVTKVTAAFIRPNRHLLFDSSPFSLVKCYLFAWKVASILLAVEGG